MRRAVLEGLVEARAKREPAVLLTWLDDGREELVAGADASHADEVLARAVVTARAEDRAALVETGSGPVFVHPHNPPVRVAIVGAVHIAQHLAAFVTRLGYEVLVCDPRTAFASPRRFPGVTLSHAWPGEALAAFGLDARSALVTLSHDPKLDDPALECGLRSPAFYLGALGSRRTQARRRERLLALGFSEDDLARIHGPVGLDLGARGPAEIALSIAAELTGRLRQARGQARDQAPGPTPERGSD